MAGQLGRRGMVALWHVKVYKFVFEPAIVPSQVLMALRVMVQRFKTKRVIQQTANLHQVCCINFLPKFELVPGQIFYFELPALEQKRSKFGHF